MSTQRFSESDLPFTSAPEELSDVSEDEVASDLAALGYPALSQFKAKGKKRNPAELLFTALRRDQLDSRLVEALPWVVLRYPDLNWEWLASVVRLNDLQNRLGYVVNVARRRAEFLGESEVAAQLRLEEAKLERSRLVLEDILCHESLTQVERRWLRKNRSREAKHWRLLTDLTPEQLDYARETNS